MSKPRLYSDEERKKRQLISNARWQKDNREKKAQCDRTWKQANAEKNKTLNQSWHEINPGMAVFYSMQRHAAKLKRTPPWVNWDEIEKLYLEAQRLTESTGIKYVVDHWVPLRGKMVSGLHVHTNLRVIPHVANCQKNNKFGCQHGNCFCYPRHT